MQALSIAARLLIAAIQLSASMRGDLLQRAACRAPRLANPYEGNERARRAGEKLFFRECAGCHGEAGRGNGRRKTPVLAMMPVKKADPGTLFWILTNGSETNAMPSFAHLPEAERWQIITYLRTLR